MPIIVQMSLPTSRRNLDGVADADEEDAMDCAFVVGCVRTSILFYFERTLFTKLLLWLFVLDRGAHSLLNKSKSN